MQIPPKNLKNLSQKISFLPSCISAFIELYERTILSTSFLSYQTYLVWISSTDKVEAYMIPRNKQSNIRVIITTKPLSFLRHRSAWQREDRKDTPRLWYYADMHGSPTHIRRDCPIGVRFKRKGMIYRNT